MVVISEQEMLYYCYKDQREGVKSLEKQQITTVEEEEEEEGVKKEVKREEGAQGLCLSRERLIFLTLIMCPP